MPTQSAEYMRKWRAANPEKNKALQEKSNITRRGKPPTEERRVYLRDRYKNDPEYREQQLARTRANHLVRRYNLTLDEKELLFQRQGFVCAVCRSDKTDKTRWHTDHCHTSKKVRGILCGHCNRMLGQARDNPAVLEAAAAYLKLFEEDTDSNPQR